MKQLLLNYTNPEGDEEKIRVKGNSFEIGRHTDNDFALPFDKLSRKHLRITFDGTDYFAEDLGSSNGTRLNDEELVEPELIKDGDKINLGGGVTLDVSMDYGDANEVEPAVESAPEPKPAAEPESKVPEKADEKGGFPMFLIIAPILLLLLLGVIGGGLLFYKLKSGGGEPAKNEDATLGFGDQSTGDAGGDDVASENTPESTSTNTGTSAGSSGTSQTQPSVAGTDSSTDVSTSEAPPIVSESARTTEKSAINFMRRIAVNDPNPVLTSKQVDLISATAAKFKGSGALATNINDARKNAAEINSIARAKNLKPQFLMNAALTKLGGGTGNVVGTATQMADVLDKLNIQIGSEMADDSLLAIAAYNQGEAGDFLQMRSTLEKLATDNPSVSSRQVRTIWFLKDKGKITPTEFDFALRFLAIGAITQNPKAFSVNAEALNL
ncbi:MAG: FHA domain-containing protein [Pyrinomonadaceae bacterium]